MKILLVTNKTLSSGRKEWPDGGYWNLFLPLKKLGHDVHFYDTVRPEEKTFDKILDDFKPDLMFCCMTGDSNLTPNEPWEQIIEQTKKGNCRTFNWFCDDTWRFDSFSSKVCHHFHVCSTPEAHYVDKFKKIGYNNILLGFWYSNIDFYPKNVKKQYDVGFCGQLNDDRSHYIDYLKNNNIQIEYQHGLDFEEMLLFLAESKIGINFSKNYNGNPPVLQMKGRMVEVPAARSLLLTEYAPGLENHYKIDKEIITFSSADEMYKKLKFLLKKPQIVDKISKQGHARFLKEHESSIRLSSIIEQIMKI